MAATAAGPELKKPIHDYLRSKNIPPNSSWLSHFTTSIRPNTPMQAVQQTALFRILASDITTSVQPAASCLLPADVSDPVVKERKLAGPLTVQVLDIEDIGQSRWSQVEALEAQERGETTKGREVVRVVAEDQNSPDYPRTANGPAFKSGPHKLLLQDAAGTKVHGFEMQSTPSSNLRQLDLGAKLILRDVLAARGVLLLNPEDVEVLGGKVESWDRQWRSERKEALKRKAGLGDEVG